MDTDKTGTAEELLHVVYAMQYVVMYNGKPMVTLATTAMEPQALNFLDMFNARMELEFKKRYPEQTYILEKATLIQIQCIEISHMPMTRQEVAGTTLPPQIIVPQEKRVTRPK